MAFPPIWFPTKLELLVLGTNCLILGECGHLCDTSHTASDRQHTDRCRESSVVGRASNDAGEGFFELLQLRCLACLENMQPREFELDAEEPRMH